MKKENSLKGAFIEGITEAPKKPRRKATAEKASGVKGGSQKGEARKDLWKEFEANLDKSVGTKGQGNAVWIPDDVMKRLKIVAAEASRNLPVRAMVTAIVTTFLDEYEKKMKKL